MKGNTLASVVGGFTVVLAMVAGVVVLKSESAKGKELYGQQDGQAVVIDDRGTEGVRVLEINTEFLWDDDGVNEGAVVKERVTTDQYNRELYYYADLIEKKSANVVGLIEIEGCHVAVDLASVLGGGWNTACKKGRDTFTGQDVAIVTRLDVRNVNDFSKFKSYSQGKKVTATKVVGASLSDGKQNYLVVVAHLISKRSNNDVKRMKQAESIAVGVDSLSKGHDGVIVMGDFNDFPGSRSVGVFKELGLLNPAAKDDCSYVYRGSCNLIDYILVSKGLGNGIFETVGMNKEFSDHSAVFYSM